MQQRFYETRSIPTCIVLSIVTCGIYAIYWYYLILTDLYAMNRMPNNAGRDILLSIVTCGIYGIYMRYQMAKLVSSALTNAGLQTKDDSTMFLILSIFGFGVIVDCLIQNDLNTLLNPIYNQGGQSS